MISLFPLHNPFKPTHYLLQKTHFIKLMMIMAPGEKLTLKYGSVCSKIFIRKKWSCSWSFRSSYITPIFEQTGTTKKSWINNSKLTSLNKQASTKPFLKVSFSNTIRKLYFETCLCCLVSIHLCPFRSFSLTQHFLSFFSKPSNLKKFNFTWQQ